MGKYVFRLHKSGGSNNIDDWGESNPINDKIVDSIKEPEGFKLKNAKGSYNDITSIPSPFARLELIKKAFKFAADNQLEGNTIYHKIISDTLDVAHIFYRYKSIKEDFEIIQWRSGLKKSGNDYEIDNESDLGKLINSSNSNQKIFGETLKLFIISDAKKSNPSFNFNILEDIYILNYKKGKQKLNIVGGTNPATLFWASANPLDFVDIKFGNDKLFDEKFCPLYERDKDFIIYFFALADAFKAPKYFSELDEYLKKCRDKIPQDIIEKINSPEYDKYDDLRIEDGTTVKIHSDFYLKCKSYEIDDNQISDCDFFIQSKRYKDNNLPVVLPCKKYNERQKKLLGVDWEDKWEPVYFDEKPLDERSIPYFTGAKYPFLCISDFFEDYIIELLYDLNPDHFITFTDKESRFLIPLKPLIFEYFSLDELQKMIKFDVNKKELKIEIPIGRKDSSVKHNIQWSRTYIEFSSPKSVNTAKDNQGAIIELQISFVCYPHFKFPENIQNLQKIVGLYSTHNDEDISFSFYNVSENKKSIKPDKTYQKSDIKENDLYTSQYYDLKEDFNVIQLNSSKTQALIFPKFKELNIKNKQMIYALDFGTTNTHIEYLIKDETHSKKFSWEDLPWLYSIRADKISDEISDNEDLNNLYRSIIYEFLPLYPDVEKRYQFPIRSLIATNKKLNEDKSLSPLVEMNIPYWFPYNEALHLEINSKIKWHESSNSVVNKNIEGFLIQLFFMIKNHALQNNTSLDNVHLITFFPASMSKKKQDQIKKLFKDHFNDVKFYSESIAPYQYFVQKGAAYSEDISVHLDIGGGTTDIVFYDKDGHHVISSVRFAGQDIFSDGYYDENKNNGWINYFFSEKLEPKLKDNKISIKIEKLDSPSLINFLFNLKEAYEIKDKNLKISLEEEINSSESFSIIIFYFFSALFYYIAKLQKQLQESKYEKAPRYVTFSGNASRLLKAIDYEGNSFKKILKSIYKDILQVDTAKLELKFEENPKEITCKGGIEMYIKDIDIEDADLTQYWHGWDNSDNSNQSELKISDIENDQDIKQKITKEVFYFHNSFFDKYLNEIKKDYEIKTELIKSFKEIDEELIRDYLIRGLDLFHENKEDVIEGESFFFYPLKQILFELGKKAYEFEREK